MPRRIEVPTFDTEYCQLKGGGCSLVGKGLITEAEFMVKLKAERAVYQEMLETVR